MRNGAWPPDRGRQMSVGEIYEVFDAVEECSQRATTTADDPQEQTPAEPQATSTNKQAR